MSSKPGGGPELARMLTMYVYLAGAFAGIIGGNLVDVIKMKTVIIGSIVIFIIGTISYSTYNSGDGSETVSIKEGQNVFEGNSLLVMAEKELESIMVQIFNLIKFRKTLIR